MLVTAAGGIEEESEQPYLVTMTKKRNPELFWWNILPSFADTKASNMMFYTQSLNQPIQLRQGKRHQRNNIRVKTIIVLRIRVVKERKKSMLALQIKINKNTQYAGIIRHFRGNTQSDSVTWGTLANSDSECQ